MRNWSQTQAQASFKGVEFDVDTENLSGGRKLVTHEYPGSNNWDNDDLGRAKSLIAVTGYVKGDDADDRAQSLFTACNSDDSGLLILPNRPPMTVRCETVESDWNAEKQGRFEFVMTFVAEPTQKGGVVASAQQSGSVAIAADEASDERTQDFSDNFNSIYRDIGSLQFIPGVARDAAARVIGQASQALGDVFGAISILDDQINAQIAFGIRTIKENALQFAYQGQSPVRIDELVFVDAQSDSANPFARILSSTLRLMTLNATDPRVMADALLPLNVFTADPLGYAFNALSVKAELALTHEVATFVRQLSLIRWAQALSRATYTSRDEAVSARAMLSSAFASEIAASSGPDAANSLLSVRDAAATFLSTNGAQLPRMVTITTARGLPAAVMAALLYNDASRDEEIWRLNGQQEHPLFLPETIQAVAPTS